VTTNYVDRLSSLFRIDVTNEGRLTDKLSIMKQKRRYATRMANIAVPKSVFNLPIPESIFK